MEEQQPLTRDYLLKQGSCCGSGCLNCPYEPKYIEGSIKVSEQKEKLLKKI